jgi:Icc-related predicted phosphoesterase
MASDRNGRPVPEHEGVVVKVATAGDIHCSEANREETAEAFAAIDGTVDLILLAGDLTTHGEPEQAQVLADACRDLTTPVVAVLGNHDWHVNRVPEVVKVIEDAGIELLDRSHAILQLKGVPVGIVGVKGHVGGFPGSYLPDFGEPDLRAVYANATREVEAIEAGLKAVETCPLRIVLLHYAPTTDTLVGEPEPIWAFLGTDRLAGPIVHHNPDLVLHGHAHAGTFEGHLGDVPVHNVSVPVIKRDFWVFDLAVAEKRASAIH